MKVVVAEVGSPPTITTYARMNARAGAKALADYLEPYDNVDMATITLDWTGDGITPVMIIKAAKTYPGWNGKWLYMNPWIIDIDDAFAKEHMDSGGLRLMAEVVSSLFHDEEEAARKRGFI